DRRLRSRRSLGLRSLEIGEVPKVEQLGVESQRIAVVPSVARDRHSLASRVDASKRPGARELTTCAEARRDAGQKRTIRGPDCYLAGLHTPACGNCCR